MADPNAVNYIGAAPLHYVCLRKTNWRGIANIILENGANIDCQTLAGKSALHFACENQLPELVEVLCLFGADTNLLDTEANTALHLTLLKEGGRDTVKQQIIEHLTASGANCLAPNLRGVTPLHLASGGGYMRSLQLLVQLGADVYAMTARGETGLHLAARSGFAEVTQFFLMEALPLLDVQDSEGNTALHACAAAGSLDCAVLLMRSGADVTVTNNRSQSPLDIARVRGTDLSNNHNPELMQMLKDANKGGACLQS
ncbi:unnamed protein product [Polarella glacialis]|uniref:Uncharacterized protein n=1 Tax=Polarella glacialis TaxID=89957 RepID=A0A813GTN5_POLGL|nr:unnamed protein product [Polarella glacialis]